MSTHAINISQDSQELRDLIAANLRAPDNVTANGQAAGQIAFVFNTDLTSAEAQVFSDTVAAVGTALNLQPSDWTVIKAQYPTIKAYVQNASPSNADSVAAIKAIARVLGAMLRQ